jgi:thiamine-monophosphate kinase
MRQPREFQIIERYLTRPGSDGAVRVGIGDDAAVVAAHGDLAVAVDTLVGGTHFPEALAADAVGHRSLAVNLSDLAAVGAKPRWATMALCLPGADESWIGAFADGFFRLAGQFGVTLIGGDTTRGPLAVTVQVIGDQEAAPLLRSGGIPGDLVFVSGSLGGAAAGLEILLAGDDTTDAAPLVERFSYPVPRIELGLALAGIAHAAIDISDGLVSDLGHVCRQSRCGARIDIGRLPLSRTLRSLGADRAIEYALNGGDDYELLFTAAADDAERVREAAALAGTQVTEIGVLTGNGQLVGIRDRSEVALEAQGFRHFD